MINYTGWIDDEVDVGYELGMAMSKLRRLKDFALDLSEDGRPYDALARGLAASGGDSPLPLLWRVVLPLGVDTNADLVARLLLPSVRVFSTFHYCESPAALLTACVLRQAGYKHIWAPRFEREHESAVPIAIVPCRIVHDDIEYNHPAWAILPRRGLPSSDQ
jgi:hypothetical protein